MNFNHIKEAHRQYYLDAMAWLHGQHDRVGTGDFARFLVSYIAHLEGYMEAAAELVKLAHGIAARPPAVKEKKPYYALPPDNQNCGKCRYKSDVEDKSLPSKSRAICLHSQVRTDYGGYHVIICAQARGIGPCGPDATLWEPKEQESASA